MFPSILKKLRKESGYKSQQAFADAFGVAQSTVGMWEVGKREPNHETTIRLAKFFNVSTDYLLGNECEATQILEGRLVRPIFVSDDKTSEKGVKTMQNEKVKTLANDIMQECQKQGFTIQDVESLMLLISLRLNESKQIAQERAFDYAFFFRPY